MSWSGSSVPSDKESMRVDVNVCVLTYLLEYVYAAGGISVHACEVRVLVWAYQAHKVGSLLAVDFW